MKHNDYYDDVDDLADYISEGDDSISRIDAIKLASTIQRNKIESERNEILKSAFAVYKDAPSTLEAIAISLGYTTGLHIETITAAIYDIARNIKK